MSKNKGLLCFLLLPVSLSAAANCNETGSLQLRTTTITPPATLSLGRDAATVGRVLWDSGWVQGTDTTVTCSYTYDDYIHTGYISNMTPSGSVEGAYQTGVQGLGVEIYWNNSFTPPPYEDFNPQYIHYMTWPRRVGKKLWNATFAPQGNWRMRLVVTGPVSPGVTSLPAIGGRIDYDYVDVQQVQIGNTAVRLNVLACVTPDVTVPLGSHVRPDFSGPGSVSPPVNFNVQVNSCPAGLSAVYYGFNPATSMFGDQNNGIVTLDSSSTASGVGVQVLYNDGSPLPFNTWLRFWSYAGAAGNYTIPLKARYYQTAANVTPGTANSYIWLAMNYQ